MFSFENLMRQMLEQVPSGFDKRQGSIIYDSLAPAAAELAKLYVELEIRDEQSYLLTATGDSLDNRAKDFGIQRYLASNSVRVAHMKTAEGEFMDVGQNTKFATPNDKQSLVFEAVERVATGIYKLKCMASGTQGNSYFGDILPLSFVNNLGSATIVDTFTPARDKETDEEFRYRILEFINRKSFGGNRADYKEKIMQIAGVGDLQIYPVWQGGGTVKLSVVDADFLPITLQFQEQIASQTDPENNGGTGLGMAPIGHRVTVCAPEPFVVNVEADVYLYSGVNVGSIQEGVEIALEGYFDGVRRRWAVADQLGNYATSVYISRAAAAVLGVDLVNNVKNLRFNGELDDLQLLQNAQVQQLPILGVVTLNAAD